MAAEGIASAWQTVFNLGNVAIGAGVLSFPLAFRLTGVLGGVCLCVLVACLGYTTLNILVRQGVVYNCRTYQELVHAALGQGAADLTSCAIVMLSFGSCVAYLIIVGDNFGAVLHDYVIEPFHLPKIFAARQVPILMLACVVALPFSLQRDLVELAEASTVAVVVMTVTTGIIVARSATALLSGDIDLHPLHLFRFDAESMRAIPIMVFAYACHVPSVPLFYELAQNSALFDCIKMRQDAVERHRRRQLAPHAFMFNRANVRSLLRRLRNNSTRAATTEGRPLIQQNNECQADVAAAIPGPRPAPDIDDGDTHDRLQPKLPGMSRVFVAACTECTALYVSAGIAGYLLFPDSAQADILNNFPVDDTLMQLMRFLIGLAVLLHYPINSHLGRSALYDLVCPYIGVVPQEVVPYSHVVTVTLAFFAASVGTACSVADLGLVFDVMGGIFSSFLVIVIPGTLVVRYARRPKRVQVGLLLAHPVQQLGSSVFEYEPLGWVIIVIGMSVLVVTMYTTLM